MLRDNPELSIDNMSLPIVTNALTHGLSLVGDLFVNQGDTILLPEHNWGNYKLVFNTRNGANLQTYPIFDKDGHYTTDSLVEALQSYNKDKVIMILGNEISLICGRNFIVVESFSGQLSGTDGCNGILLLETAVGVVDIIA